MQKKSAMDYYHHYQCFVKELSADPDLRLQTYCERRDIMWRRLYDWMRRNHISLRQLYNTYGRLQSGPDDAVLKKEQAQFTELKFVHNVGATEAFPAVGNVRMIFPSGVTVEMGGCPVRVLGMLVDRCMGKEVPDVRP